MKHQEKVHLKEDPFAKFIQAVLDFIKGNLRILAWVAAAAAVVVLVGVVWYYISLGSHARENELLARSMKIKDDKTLTLQEKIDQLRQVKYGARISSVAGLYSAVLYAESGDFAKAQEALAQFKGSALPIVNNQKQLLQAMLLSGAGKKGEAIAALGAMLADAKMQIPKDYLLLQLARIQAGDNQKPAAVASLKRVLGEFPNSFYANEARALLADLGEQTSG
jgi:hypothetical protein